jgi:hypothetical protein
LRERGWTAVTAAPSAANRAGLEVTAASFAHFGGALIRTRLLENSAENGHRIELVRVLVRSTRIWVACRVHEVGVALTATSRHHVQRFTHVVDVTNAWVVSTVRP